MIIGARSRLILEKMLVSKQALSLSDYAKFLNVSTRSVRRDLEEINAVLKSFGLELDSTSGTYTIDGPYEAIHHFKWHLFDLSHTEYTPDERKSYILQHLLKEASTVKIIDLANELTVTEATIRADLLRIEESLSDDLVVHRIPGYGVELQGKESKKRDMIRDMIKDQVSQHMLFQYLYPTKQSNQVRWIVESRLEILLDASYLVETHKYLQKWRLDQIYTISDESYLSLVVDIAITLERIRSNKPLDALISKTDDKSIQDAKHLLSKCLQMDQESLDDNEISYVASFLENSRHGEYHGLADADMMRAKSIAKQITEEIEKSMGLRFNDYSLLDGLTIHLRSALKRIEQGQKIQNPLIDFIKNDYEDLYQRVSKAMDKICNIKEGYEEEIGYLVLHFGAALLKYEDKQNYKALVICSSGIGTSKMLITKLQKKIPQLKTLISSSVFSAINTSDHDRYDIVLSTIELGKVDFDYLLISPILLDSDITKIQQYLQLRSTSKLKPQESIISLTDAMDHYKNMNTVLELIVNLLDNFEVQKLNTNNAGLHDLVRAMNMIAYSNNLDQNVEETIKLFHSKKNYGGFGITHTSLGMFHERHTSISYPVFKVFPLMSPIEMLSLDDKPMKVSTLILLLAPEKLEQVELDVLSYLSALIIEDDYAISTFESQNSQSITQFIVDKLDMYIKNVMRRNE